MVYTGDILVDTGVITAKADSVTASINRLEQTFNEMEELVSRTGSYWIGLAGDHHRQMFNDEKDDIENMLKRLKDHPRNLKDMALGYETTETAVTNVNQQLRSDYI